MSDIRGSTYFLLCGIVIASAAIGGTASAQTGGLLDALFGGLTRPPPAATPAQLPPTGAPKVSITVTPRPSYGIGGAVAYCVRLCDGGHFPLPHLASSRSTPIELCEALCPASRTRVYWGSQIDRSITSNGSRYSDLETALRYRRGLVESCTCNGKDNFGTAAISVYADVTLRPGDIVATEKGLKVFVGSMNDTHQPADFTPVRVYSGLTNDERARLLSMPMAPAPIPAPISQVPSKTMSFDTRIIFGPAPLDGALTPPDN